MWAFLRLPNVKHTMKCTRFLLLVFGCRLSVFGCRQNFEGVPFFFEIDLPAQRPQHWPGASRYLHGATMLTRLGNAEMEMEPRFTPITGYQMTPACLRRGALAWRQA
jgi:hypothetical protein